MAARSADGEGIRSISAVVLEALGDLDDAGGAKAGSAQGDELFSVLQAGDAAGSLDLYMGGNMLGEQLHIVEGGAGLTESGD